jgi:hypothetical protein
LTLSQFRALEYDERVEMAANDQAWAMMGAYEVQQAEKRAKLAAARQKSSHAKHTTKHR